MIEKHSVSLNEIKTSISLEPEFWKQLKEFAREDQVDINQWIVDRTGDAGNRSSQIRVAILQRLQNAAAK